MAKLVFGMNQSLDGYVDHLEMRPSPALFRHFTSNPSTCNRFTQRPSDRVFRGSHRSCRRRVQRRVVWPLDPALSRG